MHYYPFPGVTRAINETVIGNPRYYDFKDVGKDQLLILRR